MSNWYKEQWKKKNTKMTDYELSEYYKFADNGYEEYFWRNELTKTLLKGASVIAICIYCVLVTKISWLVIAGIVIAAMIANETLKYEVIDNDDMWQDA